MSQLQKDFTLLIIKKTENKICKNITPTLTLGTECGVKRIVPPQCYSGKMQPQNKQTYTGLIYQQYRKEEKSGLNV